MNTIDIQPKHLTSVLDILKTHIPQNAKIYVFGSRAKGCAKEYSDLDLAIDLDGEKLGFNLECKIKTAFENSLIPYTVDVVDLNAISDSFKTNIENDLIELPNTSAL